MKHAANGAFGDNVIGLVDFKLLKVVKLVVIVHCYGFHYSMLWCRMFGTFVLIHSMVWKKNQTKVTALTDFCNILGLHLLSKD